MELLNTPRNGGELSPSLLIEYEQSIVDRWNEREGDMDGPDCPICLNKGAIMYLDAYGNRRIRDCSCMAQRKALRMMQASGLSKVLNTYTWEAWRSEEPWQQNYYDMAKSYAEHPSGWFVAAGRPGTGKTHLCTAICGDLLKRCIGVRYVIWREFATRAKALVTDADEYQDFVNSYKWAKALYLDDFFKGKQGERPTAADCNLAFELLNARYADPDKLTIISTELPIEKILNIDEAIGSRIYERSKGHYVDLTDKQNWRLKS